MKAILFYTLMLFDHKNKSSGYNGLSFSYKENIQIYVNQCLLLNLSLKHFGYSLKIVTNDISFLINLSNGQLGDSDLLYLQLSDSIPLESNFYLSFHKFELIKYLASKNVDHYVIIVDSDIICLSPLPLNMINIINKGILTYYDISDQHIPAFGLKKVVNDVMLIDQNSDLGIWSGGEYFGADINGLKLVCSLYEQYISIYFKNYNYFNQKSDENIFSLSIQLLIGKMIPIYDVSKIFVINRFWSVKTLHVSDLWLKSKTSSLLHLPADKSFLSSYYFKYKSNYSPEHFLSKYEKYLISKRNFNIKLENYLIFKSNKARLKYFIQTFRMIFLK